MPAPTPFNWIFHTALPEQTGEFLELAGQLGLEFDAILTAALAGDAGAGVVVRAEFSGEATAAELRGREYWLELHSRCLDANLALELVEGFVPKAGWLPLAAFPPGPLTLVPPPAPPAYPLARQRPEIPAAPLYDLLRGDDPDLERNLDETIAWIEAAGLPPINLLSYLDLPLYRDYAAQHADERDQNLFLHMLHTWTCYRRFGAVHASLPLELAQAFTAPRYLRLNTTQFRSPAPALCLQLPDWGFPVRPPGDAPERSPQWAKEIYLTHLEPPTPADDRELTLMIVTYDERGEFGFIPLEVPLSLPGVGESIDAFFAPSAGDEEAGANTADLHRLTTIAATYCLYATAADPARYLGERRPPARSE